MPRHKYRLILIVVLIISIFYLSGCWNRRELESLAIVTGTGIDLHNDTKHVRLTAQIIKPSEVKSGEQGTGSGGKAVVDISHEGHTVFEAIRQITHISNRKLFWSHNEILIFGKEAAQAGVQKHLDFFMRQRETRPTTWILVSQGSASEILATSTEFGNIPSMAISDLVEVQSSTSQAPIVNIRDFVERLLGKTSAPVAPLVEIIGEGKDKKIYLAGTAIFKEDKMAGELDKRLTRGFLWVINEVQSGIIIVDCPGEAGKISLEIVKAGAKITPAVKDGEIIIKVEIKATSDLGEDACSMEITEDLLESLKKRQATVIENEVADTIKKAQDLNTDIFGFGEAVHRKFPRQWPELKKEWDEIFPQLEVNISVETEIRRGGMLAQPIKKT